MAKKKAAKAARPKSTSSRVKTSKGTFNPTKAAAFSEPDVVPSPITDGQPLNVYLVSLGVNRAELVDVEVCDETREFSVHVPDASKDQNSLAVSVVSTDGPCKVTRNRRAATSKREKLYGAGKSTITIRPAGGTQPVEMAPVSVALIPAS